ncbi:hypothetical protein DL89DRAFT_269060 [Linderina pennispora]|uniref:Uncharacterized protein n=1 Tax=Linderina pennispora TaxID=61395 RepID=A0A1Y1W2U0_9FUNG|nr:uncharacterized protein DL89DRAFT_269060 [Linderina pennispora]ORX67870.1 hypothetical protein DL89DRAFT_269060 [Linderina pennispora]
MTASQTHTRELSLRAHAQLFIKHALAAESLSNIGLSQVEPAEPCASRGYPHRLRISDTNNPNISHSLTFGRIRVYGTIVGKSVAEIDARKCTFYYIDDTTGIIPFMLCPCTREGYGDDLTEKSEMETRLSQGRTSDGELTGTSLVVMGQICHSLFPSTQSSRTSSSCSADQPTTWIRGHMIDIKTDPMSDIAAMMDTQHMFGYYFPSYADLPPYNSPQYEGLGGRFPSQSMRSFLQSQLSQAPCGARTFRQQEANSAERGHGRPTLVTNAETQMYPQGVASNSELHFSPHPPSAKRVRIVHLDDTEPYTSKSSHPADQSSPTCHIRKKPRGEVISERLSSDSLDAFDIGDNTLFGNLDALDTLLPSEVPAVRTLLQNQGNSATHSVLVAKLVEIGSNPEEAIEDMLLAGVLIRRGDKYSLV